MENKRGFHVTIVENKTGETLEEFDTKGMVYVHLSEVAEEDMPEKNGETGWSARYLRRSENGGCEPDGADVHSGGIADADPEHAGKPLDPAADDDHRDRKKKGQQGGGKGG